ncbi:hypothetical protein AX15_004863 [Amanita polypyramis BW_CC]|nr:hypothetical protein AX15_004863 [Amanita polypyramis BW_CC]
MSLTLLASPSVLPSSSDSDPTVDLRVVRFDNECVLIPQQIRKRSRVTTRSYSLPLWKRRSQLAVDSDSPEAASPSSPTVASTVPDESHIVLKVPLPSFIKRRPHSPARSCSPSASSRVSLSPCLVQRSPSSSPASPTSPKPQLVAGRPSLPVYHQRKGESIITVPLRACCPDCVPITEESMREGEQWKVKFTRGARRRRSASLDSTALRPFTGESSVLSHDAPSLTRHAISVDEVDRRQRSLDLTEEVMRKYNALSLRPGCMDAKYPTSPVISHPPSCSRGASTSSSSPNLAPRQTERASPIQEEDEDQLFPLPSPKRTPNPSPSPSLNIDLSPKQSPTPSQSSSIRSTPTPSPNTSTLCITSAPARPITSPDDLVLPQSLSRKALKLEIPNNINTQSSFGIPTLVLNERTNSSRSPSPAALPSPSALSDACSTSPKRSSSISHKKKFSLPFFKSGVDVLKGASADVLKGVSIGAAVHNLG